MTASEEATEQVKLAESDRERWQELHQVPLDDLSDKEKTSKLKLSLKRRYSFGEWMLIFEFGGENGRRADAIAVNTLGSRNYKIVGFELKASRSDWLREKNEGEKADHFVQLCDEWYIVAPKDVVKDSEIPDGWGYLEMKPNSEQLYKMRESDPTEYQQQGSPTRRFWVRFLKKTVGDDTNYTKEDLEEARSRGYEQAKEDMQDRQHQDLDLRRIRKKAESWDKLQDRFESIPWSKISESRLNTIDLAVQLVESIEGGGYRDLETQVERLEENLERRTEEMQENLESIHEGVGTLRERIRNNAGLEEVSDAQ